MADADIREFKSALRGVKAEIENLKDKIDSIDACIGSSRLITEVAIQSLLDSLGRYITQYAALKTAGERISISIGDDINEIENSLKVYELRQLSLQLRELVSDYFRLSGSHDRLKTSLEESKRRLMEKCSLPIAELAKEIHPYEIIIENVKNPKDNLPEEDYQLLIITLGSHIAYSSDAHNIFIDNTADISAYLDGSSSLLSPIKRDSLTGDSNTQSTDSDNLEQQVLWPDFGGYIESVTHRIEKQSTSDKAVPSEIRKLIEAHSEIPYVLSTVANEKLIPWQNEIDSERYNGVLCSEIIDRLIRSDLLTYIDIERENVSKRYITLTTKGWSCFGDKNILSVITKNHGYAAVPTNVQFCRWSNVSAYRASLICDFMNAVKTNGVVVQPGESAFMFAYADKINGGNAIVCTGVFEKGNETATLAWLKSTVSSCPEARISQFIILVKAIDDIDMINDELMLPDELRQLIRYVQIDNPNLFYDDKANALITEAELNIDEDTTDPPVLKPRIQLEQSVKLPSKQEFDNLLKRYTPVIGFIFALIPVGLMLTEKQMQRKLGDDRHEMNVAMLQDLESKGYICAYEYEDCAYYVATRLMAECIGKNQLKNTYEWRYHKAPHLYAPGLIGSPELPVDEFLEYRKLSELYWNAYNKIMGNNSLRSLLRSPLWDNVSKRHYHVFCQKNRVSRKLLLVSTDEFLKDSIDVGNGVICYADTLPSIDINTADTYYCVTDALYVWNGSQWTPVAG